MRHTRVPPRILLCLVLLAAPPWAVPVHAATAAAGQDVSAGIRAEVARQAKGQLKDFYAARGFAPLWAASGAIGPEAGALLDDLTTADIDGLKPSSYKIKSLVKSVGAAGGGDPRAIAKAELKLSAAFARYVRDLRKPAPDDMTYLDDGLKPRKLEVSAVLRSAALAQPFARYIADMGWMSPHYVRIRQLVARGKASSIPKDNFDRLRRNLARARILPGPWTHHIVVDAASGQLWYYQAGKQAGTMRVIIGRPETPTPMLAGMLQYAILNPYWNVPVDLAQHRVAPRVIAGQSLRSMGYEALSDWSAAPQVLKAAQIDWPAVASGAQEIRLRQRPGPANAMGRVKFMFPNDDGIYLHDTPERALFTEPGRHFSNGCVRLENAGALGKWLLGRTIRSNPRTPEQPVVLPVPVPVFLTYFTAGESGDLLPDVYDRDR